MTVPVNPSTGDGDARWPDEDRYEHAARAARVPYDLDDRPLWETQPPDPPLGCNRCGAVGSLDPYHECERCRVAQGWCRWCAIERIEYRTLALGRTCYRWLRRNEGRLDKDEFEQRRREVIARRQTRRLASET